MINRSNYEEFFLLYLDGELEADARQAVEAFLADQPDLMAEFQLLQDAKLAPDNSFLASQNWDFLLKKESEVISEADQSALLLLLDGELDHAAATPNKEEFLKRIANDPTLEKEWNLLQRTKLQTFEEKEEEKSYPFKTTLWSEAMMAKFGGQIADPVPSIQVFKQSATVYEQPLDQNEKKEKSRKIFFLRFTAASAVAAVAAWLLWSVFNPNNFSNGTENSIPGGLAEQTEKENPIQQNNVKGTQANTNPVGEIAKDFSKEINSQQIQQKKLDPTDVGQEKREKKFNQPSAEVILAKNEIHSNISLPTNNTSSEKIAGISKLPSLQTSASVEGQNTPAKLNPSGYETMLAGNQKAPSAAEQEATNLLKMTVDNNNQENEEVLYIGNTQIRKTALRGVIRKTGRFLERAAKLGDEKTEELFTGNKKSSKQ
jgi:hypothetical protein